MQTEVYSPREVALAAGVSEEQVIAALGGDRYVLHHEAVRIGRLLAARRPETVDALAATVRMPMAAPQPLFTLFSDNVSAAKRPATVPLALTSTLHIGLIAAAIFIATFNLAPHAASIVSDERPVDPMRLVFLATPGPGGGGGGGGLLQKAPPPKAMREGRR